LGGCLLVQMLIFICHHPTSELYRSTRLHRGGTISEPHPPDPTTSYLCYLPLPCWRFRICAKPGTTAALDDADSSCGFHGVSPLFSGRTLHVLDNFQLGYAYSELPDLQTTGRAFPWHLIRKKGWRTAEFKRSRSLSQGRRQIQGDAGEATVNGR